ncbi:MAG: putative PurR-regulated permease PerM, partial [Myxococcota bacterium]
GQVGTRLSGALKRDPAELVDWAQATFGVEVSRETMDEVRLKAQEYAPTALKYIGGVLTGALTRTMGVIGWVLNAVMIPIFVFYFLRDFDKMKAWCVNQIPPHGRPFVVERARRVDGVVGDWLRGQVQVALMLAVIYATGLAIVGIKLAIPIGILAGLLNVVPYLGFAFGFSLAMVMVLLEWSGIGSMAGVVVVFAVAQTLEGYVLTPKIVGEKVGLSPVTVIIVLLLGGELLGLLGFLLAVPVAGALKTVLVELIDWYRQSEMFLGSDDVDDPPTETEPPGGPA